MDISDKVSDGATNALVLNIKRTQRNLLSHEFDPDILNTFCATRAKNSQFYKEIFQNL